VVTALYRRYRPETFAEMIGQSQVTEPLMTALRTDRVNHAYLFSGPRGCGKTTSARILARCLNCAEGPTDTPCGVCPSCVELSRGGSGSLDVVEIDAASHNGVDDARDLRERAVFAPARDRYKIFILDEAHMVTSQGFNALLKLVEEPPDHVKFIFATTEPDKVLGTIRSRTHHYPFRLVPPAPMLEYVQKLCDEEGVQVEPGVLSLVVRAGGGSPRDTLSLLDQLIAGSEGSTVAYERAVALLGYTHGALLDEVVDAIGAGDASGAFAADDRVVQTGQDPRRFVEDLLERLRDLIVVAATSPEAAAAVLRGVPTDELARMGAQAAAFGSAELSRVADLVSQTLTEMTGATSPRLHLELMLARVLVPSADDSERGALVRVERLERRIGVADTAAPGGEPAAARAPARESRAPATRPTARVAAPAPGPSADGAASETVESAARAAAAPAAPAAAAVPAAAVARPTPVGPVTLQQVRDAWPEVLDSLQRTKRSAWMVAFTAKVREYRDDDVLVLEFPSEADVAGFRGGAPGQSVSELLRGAIAEVLGVRVKFLARVEGQGGGPAPAGAAASTPAAQPAAPVAAAAPAAPTSAARADAPTTGPAAPTRDTSSPTPARDTSSPPPANPGASASPGPTITAPGPTTTSPGPTTAAPERGRPASAQGARAPRGGTARSAASPVGAQQAAPASTASATATATATVDSWAVVAIPTSEPEPAAPTAPAATAPAGRRAPTPAAAPPATAPAVDAPALDPDEADAPPPDEEPPFDPGPEPVIDAVPVAEAAVPDFGAAVPVADGRIQRYGEAVVREVLGATFLEEVEAPPRAGFGERG
jgi:DNA polymerase III subunit gamma/tau